MKSSFFEIASVLTLVNPTDEERSNCKNLIQVQLNQKTIQQDFFEYCLNWKLAPWLYCQLKSHDVSALLDPTVLQKFEEQYQLVKNQNESRNHTAAKVLQRFNEENIPVAILKGNCFAYTVYHETGYKRMNDFDMLIRKEDWERIQQIYFDLEFIPLGFGWSGEKEKPAKFSHVGMSFISPDFSCILGSQWGLKSPTTRYRDRIEEAWKSLTPFEFRDIPVYKLSAEFNLLHLILHMGVYKCSIRDCMDVYNLLRSESIDPITFKDLLIRCNAVEKAVFTLELVQLSAPNCAQFILKELKPNHRNFLMKRLRKRNELHLKTGDYQFAYNDYFQDVEKDVIYFNLFPLFHLKCYFYFKIVTRIFIPKKKYVLKLNDLTESNSIQLFLKRWTTPGRIFALIAQEIGWKFTFLLFIKLGFDTIISLKNYIVPQKTYFDYLKSKNIDPREIEKVVKNIQ